MFCGSYVSNGSGSPLFSKKCPYVFTNIKSALSRLAYLRRYCVLECCRDTYVLFKAVCNEK